MRTGRKVKELPRLRITVNVTWIHRLKLLFTGKVYVLVSRDFSDENGIKVHGSSV